MATKMPKWPKGLKRQLNAARKKAERQKAINARKKEIEDAKKELAKLKSKSS
jgi:hypothetical protein